MTPKSLFKALSDPTRRAIFERLCREGQLSVHALTTGAGVSQPAVSKHLAQLRAAGLVLPEPQGRETFYRAEPQALAPLAAWLERSGRLLGPTVDRAWRSFEKDGPMTKTMTLTRDYPFPQDRVWRAISTGALIADWLMPNDFEPSPGHRFTFRAAAMPQWDGVVQGEVLEVDPPSHLSYTWVALGIVTEVSLRLEPVATGTRLTVRAIRFPRGSGAELCRGPLWLDPIPLTVLQPCWRHHDPP